MARVRIWRFLKKNLILRLVGPKLSVLLLGFSLFILFTLLWSNGGVILVWIGILWVDFCTVTTAIWRFCVEIVFKSGVGCVIEVLELRVVVLCAFWWFVGIGLVNFQPKLCPIFV